MADTDNQHILKERQVSYWTGLSEPTLFRHRRDGTGPKFIQLSAKRIGYRRSDVEDWLRTRECQKLSDARHSNTSSDSSPAATTSDPPPVPNNKTEAPDHDGHRDQHRRAVRPLRASGGA
jgi:predicted DNA-binding transcriptional regulator AlpA